MSEPLYKMIYMDLKQKIESSTYEINDTLPTEKELSAIYNVSTITVKKSLDLLKEEGYIIRKPRKGSVVVNNRKTEAVIDSMTIGLVITNFTDFFGAQILRTILDNNAKKINVIVKISYGNVQKENELIQELIDKGIQGLILLPTSSEYTSPKILELISQDFPIVVIDRLMDNLPICSVQTDSFSAAKELTNYLFAKNHQKIGLITSDSSVSTIDERVDGFLSAHIDANQAVSQKQILSTIDSVVPGSERKITEDIELIKTFLEENPDITALFTTEYNIALLTKSAIEQQGKSVPNDYSIVCFDHPTINIFDLNAFVFTHIEQNQTAIGEHAVNLLFEKISNPRLIEKINLGYQLIEGDSVTLTSN
ncbi:MULTISPECIES: GntR family transcriptional regulator [unclassified Enterococcus]|jgi:DNA-binding LacI/PurR family transcriptional regulator|uniref:GntR family transcriptional regulator n=1 Tax=unclassified Enterococcus TaxID=2608891 RepID=UPI0003546215|nr:transcriptional regulator, GntR family [Enterococcus faecalis 13-SD-W-01]